MNTVYAPGLVFAPKARQDRSMNLLPSIVWRDVTGALLHGIELLVVLTGKTIAALMALLLYLVVLFFFFGLTGRLPRFVTRGW